MKYELIVNEVVVESVTIETNVFDLKKIQADMHILVSSNPKYHFRSLRGGIKVLATHGNSTVALLIVPKKVLRRYATKGARYKHSIKYTDKHMDTMSYTTIDYDFATLAEHYNVHTIEFREGNKTYIVSFTYYIQEALTYTINDGFTAERYVMYSHVSDRCTMIQANCTRILTNIKDSVMGDININITSDHLGIAELYISYDYIEQYLIDGPKYTILTYERDGIEEKAPYSIIHLEDIIKKGAESITAYDNNLKPNVVLSFM